MKEDYYFEVLNVQLIAASILAGFDIKVSFNPFDSEAIEKGKLTFVITSFSDIYKGEIELNAIKKSSKGADTSKIARSFHIVAGFRNAFPLRPIGDQEVRDFEEMFKHHMVAAKNEVKK